ncbi:hypothetical protein HYPSUDRAFT_207268 [Hypholoma sublateritium FD-334 SS-4]|uniref:Uncharacterized protein n=1 Tax=Hypholoma sublateritium (strain FD-334 SS-4) TaxID=945553 RepID=A0A0D2KNQ3_HYPSF|nr:hypothetical protein HYPSUDRAFT_207268 [Hypholoma sublateritium FD-334 SS-4]
MVEKKRTNPAHRRLQYHPRPLVLLPPTRNALRWLPSRLNVLGALFPLLQPAHVHLSRAHPRILPRASRHRPTLPNPRAPPTTFAPASLSTYRFSVFIRAKSFLQPRT